MPKKLAHAARLDCDQSRRDSRTGNTLVSAILTVPLFLLMG
jgi:hypothetical protein